MGAFPPSTFRARVAVSVSFLHDNTIAIMNTTMNTTEEKPLLAKARGSLDSSSSSASTSFANGFSRASKMVAGAAGLALVGAGTLSASRAHQAHTNGLGSTAASADVVTLTLGCSPTDLLSLLPFEPKS